MTRPRGRSTTKTKTNTLPLAATFWGDLSPIDPIDSIHTASPLPPPRKHLPLHRLPSSLSSEVLSVTSPSLETSHDDFSALFHISAEFYNHLHTPIHLQKLVAILWDEEQRPLEIDTHWTDLQLQQGGSPIKLSFGGPSPLKDTLRGLDLIAHYEFPFDMILAAGSCPPILWGGERTHRRRWGIKLQQLLSCPGEPHFELSLHAFTGYRYEPAIETLIQLKERPASKDQIRELAVVFRDAQDQIVARESCAVTLHGEQSTHLKVHLGLTQTQISRIQQLNIHIQGTCARHESLGQFQIPDTF